MALSKKQSTRTRKASEGSLTLALATLAAHRRDVILEAVAVSARELLRSSDLSQSLPKVLEQIGLATGVDHAHLFEIERSGDGRILSHYLWSAPGLTPPPDLSEVTEFSMVDRGLASWMPALAKGEIVVGHARSFEGAVRRFLDNVGIKSIMAVPVFAENLWWGHLGFDACRDEREWTSTEIDTLKTLAELVGAAVARACSLKHLADANRIIENSPTILFRLGPREPFPLTFVSDNTSRYGYDAGELMTSPNRWLKLVDGEDRPALVAAIKSIASGTADRVKTGFWLRKPNDAKVFLEGEVVQCSTAVTG